MAEVQAKRRPYLWVFLWLALLTAIEIGVAGLAISNELRITLLALLAIGKALLVALYYMHLRYDQRILAVIGGFPIFLAIVMTLILLADRSMAGTWLGG